MCLTSALKFVFSVGSFAFANSSFYLLQPLAIPGILCAGALLSVAMDVFQRWAHLVSDALWEAYRIRFQYTHEIAFVAETLMLIDDSEEEEDFNDLEEV